MVATELLDRILDPVGRALSPEAARELIAMRADPQAQERIDRLADLANEGALSCEERSEYESLIAAAGVVAVLQAKARLVIEGNSAV